MKLNRTVVAGVAALAVLGGATACKAQQPTVGNPIVVIHTHVPAPVHTVIHIHITPKAKARIVTPKPKTRIVIHKH